MLATFLIAFHSRRIDNLSQVVRFLSLHHPDVVAESEIIFLCQDQCGVVDNDFLESKMINLKLPYMEKCKALNHGVRLAKSDKLVVLDSDRILPPGYFSDVLRNLKIGTAVTVRRTHRLHFSKGDNDIVSKNFAFNVENRSVSNEPFTRNLFSGNISIHKSDYWRAGGMDENYVGYGFEDNDMAMRIIQAGIIPVFRNEIEFHLFHESITYGSGDQKKMFLINGIRYCKNWDLPIPSQLQKEINDYTRNLI